MANPYLLDVRDPLGRRVTLTERTWNDHVRRRPVLASLVENVQRALEEPHIIIKHRDDSIGYYLLGGVPQYPNMYLVVIVRFGAAETHDG